jgi:hypothetical protein
MDEQALKDMVRVRYGSIAASEPDCCGPAASSCCGPSPEPQNIDGKARQMGYSETELA